MSLLRRSAGWSVRRGAQRASPSAWPLTASALLVAALMLLPIVYLLINALATDAGVWTLLTRPRTLRVLLQTLALAGAVTAATVLLGVPLAWLTVASDLPGRRVIATLLALPLVIPTYIGGYTMIAAWGPRGALQGLLQRLLGIERLPELYGFWGAWLALTLFTYPYVVLSVQSALRGLDPALEEAARSLGHSAWHTFWRVTLPQLRPAIAAGGLLVALYTLSDFGAVSLLQFDSFSRVIYLQYLAAYNRDYASVLALLLVALTALVLGGEIWTRGRLRYHRSTVGSVRPRPPTRLGAWRWPALALCGLVILGALVVPVGVVLFWLARALRQGEPLQPVWLAAWNSLSVSALAAGLTITAALPVAVLSVRHRSRLTSLLEGITYAGYALPGIVIALALVRFGARYLPALYQTLPLLLLAYVLRFLPQALGAIRATLLHVNPRLEEAARSLGRTPRQVLLQVTLPLIRSGLFSGAALVFLTTMKELPATLLLSPIGFKSLATITWSATTDGFFGRAAAPALLLILVSAASMAVLLRDIWTHPQA